MIPSNFKKALCSFIGLSSMLVAQENNVVKMPEKFYGFFENYCLDCHDTDTEKGDFNIEDLPFKLETIETAEKWKHVLNSINAGEMPPEDKKQPKPNEKAQFLEVLSKKMVEARKALSDSGGEITMRRLNRREYVNSMETLLGIKVDASDLPSDSSSLGFDTSGKSLFFSSDQFEQYMAIAKTALAKFFAIPKGKPEKQVYQNESETASLKFVMKQQAKQMDVYERAMTWKANKHESPSKYGFIDEERVNFELLTYNRQAHNNMRYLSLPRALEGTYLCFDNPVALAHMTLPKDAKHGTYILRAYAGLLDTEGDAYVELGTGGKNAFTILDSAKVEGSLQNPKPIEFKVDHQFGENLTYYLRLRVPNNNQNVRRLYFESVKKTGLGPKPNIWIDRTEIIGPVYKEWPLKQVKQTLPEPEGGKIDRAYAEKVLKSFAWRAFRGKGVSGDYIDALLSIYDERLAEGMKFKEAIQEPMAVILSSPSFLYLPEPTKSKPKARPLDQRELAVRLAYFLWSSPPDYILIKLAKQKKLSDPEVLTAQVQRMLKDDRSMNFISAFCHQWLHMERLDFFQFNIHKYYDFDESAKEAARQEVFESFAHAIKNGQGLGGLLSSNQVIINDLMADYYNIPNVKGSHFRPVKLESGSKRGGLLGMAAILAMGSDGENSSPVERGSWILRKILNDPPPPAPPNVPQLGEVGKGMTKREMLKVHTEEPQCRQCHQKIDPIGFGLENFNAAGKWVEQEMVQKQQKISGKNKKAGKVKWVKQSVAIDASGKLHRGPKFSGFDDLKGIIAKHDHAFAEGFVEHLIEYALGRPYGFTDDDLAASLMEKAKAKNLRMDTIVEELVLSREFQSK